MKSEWSFISTDVQAQCWLMECSCVFAVGLAASLVFLSCLYAAEHPEEATLHVEGRHHPLLWY